MADATENTAPDSVNTPPSDSHSGATSNDAATPDAGSKATPAAAADKPAKAPRKTAVGGTTKGTTGNPTTTASGDAINAAAPVKAEEVATTTGSDPEVKKVYNGEAPMSNEDMAKAQRGSDPLTRAVPENDPTGGLGPHAAAQNSSNNFGPTGSIMTGSKHEVQKEAIKEEKAAVKQGEKEAADEDITPA